VLFGLELPLLFAGLGIWALVIGYVAAAIVNTGYLLVAARGLPLPGWRRPILRFIQRSLPYQAPLLAQATVGLVSATLVAALLGAKGVGFFTWATVLATPIVTVVFTLEAVVAPSLARMLRDDGSQYSQATSVVLLTFAALSATAVGAFIGLVPPIVRFVFGARWLPAVGATQLALAGVVPASLVAGCASVVNSQDQPGKRLRASLAAGATAVILTVPITLAAGVAGAAAVAYVVCPLVEVVVLAPSARAGLGYLGIRIARLGLPLAAGSFALARAATSPALLVASVAAMAVAATTLLVLAERDLVRSLWRRIASPPAVAP
jgi:O-antigen/teichoic acid export membrane protein